MKPELIEQFCEATPDGVTVRISLSGRDVFVRKPARKRVDFGDGFYYFEADTKVERDAAYEETEVLIDSSQVLMLTRLTDR